MHPGDELIALKAFSHLSGVKAVTPAFVCHDPEGEWIADLREEKDRKLRAAELEELRNDPATRPDAADTPDELGEAT